MKTKTLKTDSVKATHSNGITNGNGSPGNINNLLGKKISNALRDLPVKAEAKHKLELLQQRAANTVKIGFEKAVAHMENPSLYPLPTGNNSVEKAFYELLMVLPNSKRKKVTEKINETLKASSQARGNLYGDLADLDFSSAVSITEQVKTRGVPAEMKINENEEIELQKLVKQFIDKPVNTGYSTGTKPVPRQAVSASKVSFFIDNMTCLNPDDLRKDEISIAGVAFDSFGNTINLAPLFIGKFRKDETVNLNEKSKLFTLDINPDNLVQSFNVSLFIIESDLIENQEIVDKLQVLIGVIGLALLSVAIVLMFAAPVFINLILALVIASSVLSIISHYFIPLIGDDISFDTVDVLSIEDKVDVGETFTRTLTIGKGFDINSTFDGKYTANAKWVGEL